MSEQETKLQQVIFWVKKRQREAQHSPAWNSYFIGLEVNEALYLAEDRDAALERISEECGLSRAELEQCADLAHVFTHDGFKRLIDQGAQQGQPWSIATIAELARTVKVLAETGEAILELGATLQAECQKPAHEWGLTAELNAADGSLREFYFKVGDKLREVLTAHGIHAPQESIRGIVLFPY